MQRVAMATPPVIAQRNVSSGIAISLVPAGSDGLRSSVPFHSVPIGLLACLDGVVQGILLAVDDIAALFHEIAGDAAGVLAEVGGLLFQKFLALVRLVLQDFTGFLAR